MDLRWFMKTFVFFVGFEEVHMKIIGFGGLQF
jgi:hypothetical protein